MRTLTEIRSTELTTGYNSLEDMANIQNDVIRFVNYCLGVCVIRIDIQLRDYRIHFFLDRESPYTPEQLQVKIAEQNEFKMTFMPKGYKISWKKVYTAESFHKATSVEELKEQYKYSSACKCNNVEGKWVIDKITLS